MDQKKNNLKVTNNRYRLNYHVMGPSGWINDPNGFCFFKGYYHIFYQYHPDSSKWGPMHWGHARSQDLVHWEQLPIALYPGDAEDPDGCFSGSAIEHDGRLYLIYTGQHLKDGNPDNYWETQNLAVSDDGVHFTKCDDNPIIGTPPVDNAADFRDPKIWFDGQRWLVVVGSKNKEGLGRVILYASNDLHHWQYIGPVATAKSVASEGFVWECPDLFKLDGQDVLVMSPQGIESNGLAYRNLFQTGYLVGRFDSVSGQLAHGVFKELDHGHDFYATQTMLAPDGRRILFAWMAMWESEMPEQQDGWAGALTFPRELTLRDGKLLMVPVREIAQLREKVLLDEAKPTSDTNCFVVPTKSLEYLGKFNSQSSMHIKIETINNRQLIDLNYEATKRTITLKKYNDDQLREVQLTTVNQFDIHMLLDNSSLEIFVNDGEACFSERLYEEQSWQIVTESRSTDYQIKIYQLGGL